MIVFPHAGGGTAAYVRLGRELAARGMSVAIVRYPGRETRMHDPVPGGIGMLAHTLAGELAPLAAGTYSFFGHSMGALLAFELAHRWQSCGLRPRHLWLSGRRAPQIPADRPHLHALPDAEFLAAVNRRYEALPAALLAVPELVELMLPVLRADFRCVETYVAPSRLPLDVPITILRGREDRWIDATAVAGWGQHTTGGVDEVVFPGGHFYLDAVLRDVAARLAERAADSPMRMAG